MGLKGSILNYLHIHLSNSSPNEFSQKTEEIIQLSNLLFEELNKQFELLDKNDGLCSDERFSSEDLLLLFKCCVIVIPFLDFDLSIVVERCQILVGLIEKLCTPNRCGDAVLADLSVAIFEVFLEELLMHHELSKHFIMAHAPEKISHGNCIIKRPTCPDTSLAIISEDFARKFSSARIASHLKEVRKQIIVCHHEDHRASSGEVTEMETADSQLILSNIHQTDRAKNHGISTTKANTCGWDIFLKFIAGDSNECTDNGKNSCVSGLADFVEIKPGKDYSSWLEKRARYSQWRYKKASSIRRNVRIERRKTLCGSLSCS